MQKIAILGVLVAAGAILVLALPHHEAAAADDLAISSTITYDIQNTDVPVRVTWDVNITDNDPATQPDGSGTLTYYDTVNLPVVRGAANVVASDEVGRSLSWKVTDVGKGVAESLAVNFADPLFYGDSYSLRVVYELPAERTEGILITPNYAFLPVITAGDESTVIVNTPPGAPWQTTLEARECPGSGNTYTCSGGEGAYVAATAEVVRPAAITRANFAVEMENVELQVELAYLQGEDAAAAHQRDLLVAALPLIEEIYGVPYDGPRSVRVAHGGRQSILGYEGLATCTAEGCELVVSPVADDYTVLHEAAHLWSDMYTKRWLAEGFAELVAHEVVPVLPDNLFQGAIPERRASGANLQLDDWGDAGSIIGADAEQIASIEAGYDYSLRFLQTLRTTYGLDLLREVNRATVATGPTDSRKFMDLVEQQTEENLDGEFLLWVFPESYRPILQQRRQARESLVSLRGTLAAEGLADTPLLSIEQHVSGWQFDEALVAIGLLEANLDTYVELSNQLDGLTRDAEAVGLVLSAEILESLNRFDFNAASNLLESSRRALDLYLEAQQKLDDDRSVWIQFGLLGSDPDDELTKAAEQFEEGQFTESAESSENAVDLVDGASDRALRRMLAVGGLLLLMALMIGAAVGIGRWRYRVSRA